MDLDNIQRKYGLPAPLPVVQNGKFAPRFPLNLEHRGDDVFQFGGKYIGEIENIYDLLYKILTNQEIDASLALPYAIKITEDKLYVRDKTNSEWILIFDITKPNFPKEIELYELIYKAITHQVIGEDNSYPGQFKIEENILYVRDKDNLTWTQIGDVTKEFLGATEATQAILEQVNDILTEVQELKTELNRQIATTNETLTTALQAANEAMTSAQSINIRTFNSVEEMKASNTLKAGALAKTQGFSKNNDGGGAEYLIVDSVGENIVDEISVITLKNNLYGVYLVTDARNRIVVFNNLSDMKKNTKIKAGYTLKTLGYYNIDDGGEAEYTVVTNILEDLTPDDGSVIQLQNNLYAKLLMNDDVNVHQFGAKGDAETDDTDAIQKALNFCKGVTVRLLNKGYIVRGKLTLPAETKLVGTKKGFTQTNICVGETRDLKVTNVSRLLLIPNDMENTTITMNKNSMLCDLEIVYPEQQIDNMSPETIKTYPQTIEANSGCGLDNIATWGATNFYKHAGERIYVNNLFGYTYGIAIWAKDGRDVGYINNIHLNPNVVRPNYVQYTLNNNIENIGLFVDEYDGINVSNIHTIYYAKSIKASLLGGGARSLTINNFWFDTTGSAFDLNLKAEGGVRISNGVVVLGYSKEADNSGLLVIDTSTNAISPVLITGVTCRVGTVGLSVGGVKPTNLIKFKQSSGCALQINNCDLYGSIGNAISYPQYNQVYGYYRGTKSKIELINANTLISTTATATVQQEESNV